MARIWRAHRDEPGSRRQYGRIVPGDLWKSASCEQRRVGIMQSAMDAHRIGKPGASRTIRQQRTKNGICAPERRELVPPIPDGMPELKARQPRAARDRFDKRHSWLRTTGRPHKHPPKIEDT